MKPTSIVFLVVAVLLIIGGMITCSVAKNIAETDGYSLFHETEDGTSYRQYEFTDKPVTIDNNLQIIKNKKAADNVVNSQFIPTQF